MDMDNLSNQYITIQSWMRTELNLKGNDLLVYAIIYGFSMKEGQKFYGGLQYLADWCGSTKHGVMKNLNNLIDLGLIKKEECVISGVKTCKYWCVTKLHEVCNTVTGYVTKLHGGYVTKLHGMKHSYINNIYNNIEIDKKKDKKEDKGVDPISNFVELYRQHCTNLVQVHSLRDKRKKAIMRLLNNHTQEEIVEVFDIANTSDFLTGKNDRGWKADLDFILREDKFISILEGKYNNRKGNKYGVVANNITKQEKEDRKNGKGIKARF